MKSSCRAVKRRDDPAGHAEHGSSFVCRPVLAADGEWAGIYVRDSRTEGTGLRQMQVSESIRCPFCGQSFELVIDTSVESQRFTTDCEVCCWPFEVFAECEPGEVLSLDAQGG